MILDYFGDLNWLAILVAAIAWFVFSAIWYSVPPLSSAWQRAAKVTPADGPPLVMLLIPTFIGYFVTTVVIALLAKAIQATDCRWVGSGCRAGSWIRSNRSPGHPALRAEGRFLLVDQRDQCDHLVLHRRRHCHDLGLTARPSSARHAGFDSAGWSVSADPAERRDNLAPHR